MKTHLFTGLLSFCFFLSSSLLLAKDIQYVSDDLTIPMRSGITNAHKILKFLNSGVALEVVEVTEDGKHALVAPVDDESKTGWVETQLLMPKKSAREQLLAANKKNQLLKEQRINLQKNLSDIKKQNGKLQQTQLQLENDIKKLQGTLTRIRESASKPIRLADENEQLKQQLASVKSKNKALTQENIILGDQNIKQWFMIGGGVSIGSLILGLLITRIRWSKKDRWA